MKQDNLALITESELSLGDKVLNREQLQRLLTKTPAAFVRSRPAKGGGTWKYVSGGYVKKVLNLMFGFNWDFEVVSSQVAHGEVIVLGRLTCRVGDHTIVKMQYGNKDIICKKGTDTPLSIGNDMKSAATDALKKCAAEIGIAADIYNADEFREVKVSADIASESKELSRILDAIESAKDMNAVKEIIKKIRDNG